MLGNTTHAVRFQIGHEVAKTGLFPGTNIPPECPAPGAWKPAHDCGLYGIRHDLYSRGGCVRFSESVPSSSASAAAIGNLSWACATRSRKESTSDIFRRSASCENECRRYLGKSRFGPFRNVTRLGGSLAVLSFAWG